MRGAGLFPDPNQDPLNHVSTFRYHPENGEVAASTPVVNGPVTTTSIDALGLTDPARQAQVLELSLRINSTNQDTCRIRRSASRRNGLDCVPEPTGQCQTLMLLASVAMEWGGGCECAAEIRKTANGGADETGCCQ